MPNCEGVTWRSFVSRPGPTPGTTEVIEIATLKIGSQNPDGTFKGTFTIDGGTGEEVDVTCTGAKISFQRPKAAPVYLYDGIFVFAGPVAMKIKGERTKIGAPLEEIRAAFANSAGQPDATLSQEELDRLAARAFLQSLPLMPDDWTGERT